ncbi:MAG: patatin-like phospholipase family protein [Anaerolineae bacterium]|nr:patatin-like phospholipase family protein [Anaerolineae bacterium]
MTPIYILRNIPLFKSLDDETLKLIANRLTRVHYTKGEFVFKEGDFGDTMYLVESGQVGVIGEDAGDIARLGPGSFVGEISLLLAQPRTASLQILIDAELWALSKSDLEALLDSNPSIGIAMMRELSQRLVTTTQGKRRPVKRQITALITSRELKGWPVWGGGELAKALHEQLDGPIGVLPLPGIDAVPHEGLEDGVMVLDNDLLDETYLAKSLSYQIEAYKHIIILVPDERSALNVKAVELSDTAVTIGSPSTWLLSCSPKYGLWPTKGTAGEPGRIARRLTNRTIGLALSSGGSRGLAHVGVIKVLMEENIPIDLIAGTSAGAMFGSFFAAGWPWERFETLIEEMKTVNNFTNWDFNIPPRTGVLKGRKARDKIIYRWADGQDFEDLKIPLLMVAADILTGDEVIFDSGSLADAIRASLSIPVLVEPWHYQNRYLVDGGIVNPLPANILRDRGADIVIGSSVIQPLRESYSGRRDKMPSVFQVVFNMFSAMEAEVVRKQLPLIDVLIEHKVSAEHSLDFDNVNELVEIGEASARQMLPAIQQAIEKVPDG